MNVQLPHASYNTAALRRFMRGLLLVFAVATIVASCGELSLQSMLAGEQGGRFSLNVREVHLAASGRFTFSTTGGVQPYMYELKDADAVGELDATTGRYTAPDAFENGSVIDVRITATDYAGARDSAIVRLYDRLTVDPHRIELVKDHASETITVSGGIGEYVLEVDEGSFLWDGSAGPHEGTFTYSPPEGHTGPDAIRVYDSLGNRVSVAVTVFAPEELRITPSSKSVVLDDGGDDVLEFDILGGVGPYSVEQVPEGFGVLDWEPGDEDFSFTVSSPGTAVITVTDSVDNTATTTVVVTVGEPEALSLDPPSVTLSDGQSVEFEATGGVQPYEFSVQPGAGYTFDVVGNAVEFTFTGIPPGLQGKSWEITVTDALGNSVSSTVHHDES